MVTFNITTNFANFIKSERKKRNIKTVDLSKSLKKSSSFISIIENKRMSTIEVPMLYQLINKIIDLHEDLFQEYIISSISDIAKNLSIEELYDESWLISLDLTYRSYHIEGIIIDHINSLLSVINLSNEEIICKINDNYNSNDEMKEFVNMLKAVIVKDDNTISMKYNIRYFFEVDFLDKILNKEISKISYINLFGIIYHLNLFTGINSFDSIKLTESFLLNNNILNICDYLRFENKSEEENNDDTKIILKNDTESDLIYNNITKDILKYFDIFMKINIDFTVEHLTTFNKNLSAHIVLMFDLINLPFYKLKKISDNDKSRFLLEINNLINKYKK